MSRLARFSTDDLTDQDINLGWNKAISNFIGRVPVENAHSSFTATDARHFKSLIEYGDIGAVNVCRVQSSAYSYQRKRTYSSLESPPWMLLLQLRGSGYVEQDGISTQLRPGYWSLYDTSKPFSMRTSVDTEYIILTQHFAEDQQLASNLSHVRDRAFGRAGLGHLVRDMTQSIFRETGQLSTTALEACSRSLAILIQSTIDQARYHPTHHPRSKLLLADFIEENLHKERLTVAAIASEFGYSVRQIHRAFQSETGTTVADYIWNRRLQKCFEDLRDHTKRNMTITQIAFSWGFSCSAHFSRSFKEKFGISPRNFRISDE